MLGTAGGVSAFINSSKDGGGLVDSPVVGPIDESGLPLRQGKEVKVLVFARGRKRWPGSASWLRRDIQAIKPPPAELEMRVGQEHQPCGLTSKSTGVRFAYIRSVFLALLQCLKSCTVNM
jgi:hypothetical protein